MAAYCPNCNAEVMPTASECSNCSAWFGEGADWKPTPRPGGPVRKLEIRPRKSGTPETGVRADVRAPAFLARPAVALMYVPVLYLAAIGISGGWVMWVYFFAPHYALIFGIPISIAISFAAFALFEGLGQALKWLRALTFMNYFAGVSILSLALGALPFRIQQRPVPPSELLLEDYAAGVAFHGALLAVMGAIWWAAYLARRKEKFTTSAASMVVSSVLICAPFATYGIAETSKLHAAVRDGDIEKVASALKPWKSLNGRDRAGSTPLSIAISSRKTDVAQFLLKRGALVAFTTSRGERVDHLAQAIQHRHLDMVSMVLGSMEKIEDERPAYEAIQSRSVDVLRFLLHKGSPVSRGLLLAAVRKGDIEAVKLLLESGALRAAGSVTDHDLVSATFGLPKTMASRSAIGDLLVGHGVQIAAPSEAGHNLLEWVVSAGDRDGLQWLIDRGYPLNAYDAHGRTALHIAASKTEEMVALLLKAGAAVNALDERGRTPLAIAVERGHLANAIFLLKAGADPNAGRAGVKPIEIANRTKQYMFLGPLRDRGAKE